MPVRGHRIIVVGASGVLGGAIAEGLIAEGALIEGTASSQESVDRIPAVVPGRHVVDLEDPNSIAEFALDVTASGPVDGIVIASGVVAFGTIAQTAPEVADQLMQVNHLGPAALIAQCLPALTASAEQEREPFVLSICGVVAERAFPGMAAYVASKTAHSAWLRALRMEVRRPAVRVIDARPGHTETGLAGRAVFGEAPRMPEGMTPAHVADVIVSAISGDATEIPSTDF
jgi:cyclic-di-GMP-binding biofilm dispersal mediator protein